MPRKKQPTHLDVTKVSAGSSEAPKTRTPRPRLTAPWTEKPFGLVIGRSRQVKEQFATAEELVEKVKSLGIGQRARAFVCRFKAVEVETKLNMPDL